MKTGNSVYSTQLTFALAFVVQSLLLNRKLNMEQLLTTLKHGTPRGLHILRLTFQAVSCVENCHLPLCHPTLNDCMLSFSGRIA